MTRRTHKELERIALSRRGVGKHYDSLKEEFDLFETTIKARLKAKKTQKNVVKKKGGFAKSKPLTNKKGEVRELTRKDIRSMCPAREMLSKRLLRLMSERNYLEKFST